MIVRTENATYELDQRSRRLRRVGDGDWQTFDRVAPVVVGQPMQTYVCTAGKGARHLARFRVWKSSPVVTIADARRSTERLSSAG